MTIYKKIFFTAIYSVFALIYYQSTAYSRSVTTYEIYQEAKNKNYNFLNILKKYQNAIDFPNAKGDTAYCIALKNNDFQTQVTLLRYGANKYHQCTKQLQQQSPTYKTNNIQNSTTYYEDDTSTNYLLWGGGIIATAGVVALAAGGGGGGNSDSSFSTEISAPNRDYEENYDSIKEQELIETKISNSSYLDMINAAGAYAIIYDVNESGELEITPASQISTSSTNYDDTTVTVGIIDTGVYKNNDLEDKIINSYDLNDYNNSSISVYSYVSGNNYYYIFEIDGIYYVRGLENYNSSTSSVSKIISLTGVNTIDELKTALEDIGLDYEDFSALNDEDYAGSPGTSAKDFNINKTSSWWSYIYSLSHGTHVAGIITSDTYGVASQNTNLSVVSWDLEFSGDDLTEFQETIISMMKNDNVSVFNSSWGLGLTDYEIIDNLIYMDNQYYTIGEIFSKTYLETIAYITYNDGVWVQAAGNEDCNTETGTCGYNQVDIYSAIGNFDLSSYYDGDIITDKYSDYTASFITVINLDEDGVISSSSNGCGDASSYCIAAPGTNITSTIASDDGTLSMTGTSMAAPVVTGSIALLEGYYPWLSAQNVAWLLLYTANDEGIYSDSDVYGVGLLDLYAAVTTSVGTLNIASNSSFDSLTSVSSSTLALSSVIQNKLLSAMPETITAFDALDRPFEYATANLINTTNASSANLKNSVGSFAMANNKTTVTNEKLGFNFSSSESMNNSGYTNLSNIDLSFENSNSATRFFYSANSRYDNIDTTLKSNNNPFLNMNEAYGAESTIKFTKGNNFKLSLQTGENGLYDRDVEQDNYDFDEQSFAVSAEYNHNITDYFNISTLGGTLYEDDALLGLNGEGIFNLNDSTTYYVGIKFDFAVTQDFSVIAAYYRGYTDKNKSSVLTTSNIETESFNLSGEYMLNKSDKIGFSFSSPLSVVKGDISMQYATGRDSYSDTVYMNTVSASLTPEAKEYDVGIYYQGEILNDINLIGKMTTRFNADGTKNLTDYIAIFGLSANF